MSFVKLDTALRNNGDFMAQTRGAPFAVYIILATHIDRNRKCFPSLETLARATGYSRRVVIRAVEKLESVGAISVVRRRGAPGEPNQSNIYTLHRFVGYGRDKAPASAAPPTDAKGVTVYT